MEIAIVGSGYVGLVTGVCLAEFGHSVTCVDTDQEKVNLLSDAVCPIYEPGLEDLLRKNLIKERLRFTANLSEAVPKAEVIFIAVGTPSCRRGSGYADMGYVHEAARSLALHLNDYTVIATKSTVPVGTASQVDRIIRETNPQADFAVASNPEFLREGAAVRDFMHPNRVFLGNPH